jgi:hypothetical protein
MSLYVHLLNKCSRNFLGIKIPKGLVKYSTSKSSSTETSGDCERGQSKAKKKTKTPKGRLDDNFDQAPPVFNEKEPLQTYPNNVNPKTGEVGGPKGKHI